MRTRVSNSRGPLRHATAIAAALFISVPSDAQEKTTEPARDGASNAAMGPSGTTTPPSLVKGLEYGPKGAKGETGAHSEATTKMERRKQEEQGKANLPPRSDEGAHSRATTTMERHRQEQMGKANLPPRSDEGAHSRATTTMERHRQEQMGKAKMGPKSDYGAHNVTSSKAQQMKPMPEAKSPKL